MLCRGGRGWSWVSLLSPPQRWARLSMAVAPCVLLLPLPGPFPVHGPCHAQPHCSHPWPHSCGGNGCWTRSSRRTSRKTRRWCCWPWTTCSRCPSSSAPHPAGTTAHLSLQAPFLHPTSVCLLSFEFPLPPLSRSHTGKAGEEHWNRSPGLWVQTWPSLVSGSTGRAVSFLSCSILTWGW